MRRKKNSGEKTRLRATKKEKGKIAEERGRENN